MEALAQKPKRLVFGKIIKWVFILFNVLRFLYVVSGFDVSNETINNSNKDAEGACAVIGAAG